MAASKKAPEVVEGEVVNQLAVPQPAKMEFRLINPTEDGFLRTIQWNKEELEAAVRQKIAAYQNVVYTEDNMKQAKADRAELNKLTKDIEDRRKMVKKIIMEPYTAFEGEIKEVLGLIKEPVNMIDQQVKAFEEQQKEEKRRKILESYEEVIGDLAEVLPFEKVFDNRYLNATYKLGTAQAEIKEKVEKVRTDLETIDSLDSKYMLNAKDVYIKTLDLSKALAENKRLSDLEEKLEAERKRQEEARRKKAERKRQEEARRKKAERKRQEEARRKKAEDSKAQEAQAIEQQESVTEQQESIITPSESVPNEDQTAASVKESTSAPVVDPFAPKQEEVKKFRTKFCAVGTREQLEGLIQYMKDNNIEYGRI